MPDQPEVTPVATAAPLTLDHGDFLRVIGGNVHIFTSGGYDRVWMACGNGYSYQGVAPATGDEPGQCAKCWEAM